jgi:hypothetical protein
MRVILVMIALTIFLVSCNQSGKSSQSTDTTIEVVNAQSKTYECEQFSISYPNEYYAKEEINSSGSRILFIGRDSLDNDMTSILWKSPGSFPSNERDFITLFVSKEIEDYKKDGVFYDVMTVDSTFTIDGYPTYSISSIFTEGTDTIIQSRTGLIIPNKLNMMIVQRANTNKQMDEVQMMIEIIQSIKIKE